MKWLHRRATKRTLLVLGGVLFIVGGAIINVAVAWGFAISEPDFVLAMEGRDFSTEETRQIWSRTASGNWVDPQELEGHVKYLRGASRITLFGTDPNGPPCNISTHVSGRTWWVEEMSYGWPENGLAFWLQWKDECGLTIDHHSYRCIVIRRVAMIGSTHDIIDVNGLPLSPRWPGFAINTIFYAGILWMLFTAPGFVRRRIRIMRHCCPACGYLIGVSPVCTECGVPVTRRDEQAAAR